MLSNAPIVKVLHRCVFIGMLVTLLGLGSSPTQASEIKVFERGSTTLVYIPLALDGELQPLQSFVLGDPYRLTVDLALNESALLTLPNAVGGRVIKTEVERTLGGLSRMTFSLDRAVELKPTQLVRSAENSAQFYAVVPLRQVPRRDFVASGFNPSGQRIIIDPRHNNRANREQELTNRRLTNKLSELPVTTARAGLRGSNRKPIVVIDPGHGGKDSGAQGAVGVPEKQLVLDFGAELARMLRDSGRYQVYMTRNSDVFIPLRQRTALAREVDADLFISVHADSSDEESVRGASVYYLSEDAAYAEADSLAERADRSNLLDGMDLNKQDSLVSSILIGLAQRETIAKSAYFARELMDEMSKTWPTVRRPMRRAGFAVLKSPEMPSVLLEMGFITNSQDAAILLQPAYRQVLADRVLTAIDGYFTTYPVD